MEIDFEKIPKDRRVAVRIPTKECAEIFFRAMKNRYPDKMIAWNRPLFYSDYEKYDGGMCYVPHFENNTGMSYWSVNGAISSGVPVLDWEYISSSIKELPIKNSDVSIDSLLFG